MYKFDVLSILVIVSGTVLAVALIFKFLDSLSKKEIIIIKQKRDSKGRFIKNDQ